MSQAAKACTTRRALFGGAFGLAAIAAPVAALAAPPAIDDAQTFRLIAQVEKATAEQIAAADALSVAWRRRWQLMPPTPEVLKVQPGDRMSGWISHEDRREYILDMATVRRIQAGNEVVFKQANGMFNRRQYERGLALIAALEEHHAASVRVAALVGQPGAEAACTAADQREWAALARLREHRPKTLVGLKAKAAVARQFLDDEETLDTNATLWAQALLADTLALGAA